MSNLNLRFSVIFCIGLGVTALVDASSNIPATAEPAVVEEHVSVAGDVVSVAKNNYASVGRGTLLQTREQQESYALGMMVAQYTREIQKNMQMLSVFPDEERLTRGILDTLQNKALLSVEEAQVLIGKLYSRTEEMRFSRESPSLKTLSDIVRKSNTLARASGIVWVGTRKGLFVSEKDPIVVTLTGRFHLGEIFDDVHEIRVTHSGMLPDWLRRAVRLAGRGGQVEVYAIADRLKDGHRIPEDAVPWQIVQYTVRVDKD